MDLMGITNDLLEYSRIEHPHGTTTADNINNNNQQLFPVRNTSKTTTFELPLLIDKCVAAVTPDAAEKRLDIECHYTRPAPTSANGINSSNKNHPLPLPFNVVGYPNRLRRVLFNLLENAIKYTPTGKIELTATVLVDKGSGAPGDDNSQHQHGGYIMFEISDTGIGIDPSQQARIFEKYHRVPADDTPASKNYSGTGLGLAICRGVVEAMGGNIGCSRSQLGVGSTFFFKIPLQLPESAPNSPSKPVGPGMTVTTDAIIAAEKSLRILVVEDNKINQKMVRSMLQRIGHAVTIAENGQVAVTALKGQPTSFDLILMDIMMPVMDGLQATKEIRNMGLSKETLPIIGLTASFQPSERSKYIDVGMTDCLGKPVKLASLKRAINLATSPHPLK